MNNNNNAPETISGPGPKRTFRRRHGKIGRLPVELRDFVNQSLLQGHTYARIILLLAERGHPGVNAPNLVAWAKGGYQDWLREREQATQFRARCEAIVTLFASLPPETRAEMGDVNNFSIALQLGEILQQHETGGVSQFLNQNPENFFRLAGFVTNQSAEKNRTKRLELESQKFQMRLTQLGLKPGQLGAVFESLIPPAK